MLTRRVDYSDLRKIREIHEKFYEHEFEFPDFNFFQKTLLIENEKGIITAGGIRPISESIIMTNKDFPSKTRVKALVNLVATQMMDCNNLGYDSLHCFIQEPEWKNQLIKVGFKPTKGDALVLVLR